MSTYSRPANPTASSGMTRAARARKTAVRVRGVVPPRPGTTRRVIPASVPVPPVAATTDQAPEAADVRPVSIPTRRVGTPPDSRRGENGDARMWQMHYEAIGQQGAEWAHLRKVYPDAPLVVAGDFSQSRDGSGCYGTHRGRALLTTALQRAGLTCLTEEDVVAQGLLAKNHLIDHIAASPELLTGSNPRVVCWEMRDADGVRLSDHPTIAVDFQVRCPDRPDPLRLKPIQDGVTSPWVEVATCKSPRPAIRAPLPPPTQHPAHRSFGSVCRAAVGSCALGAGNLGAA